MNHVLCAKMDKVFSLKKTLKKYWKMEKNTGKVREFCQSGKVGTMWLNCKICSCVAKNHLPHNPHPPPSALETLIMLLNTVVI